MKKRYSLRRLGICLLLSGSCVLSAQNPGQPDPPFGQNGRVVENLCNSFDQISGMAVLPNGNLVTAGHRWTNFRDYVFASRHLPDGSIDNTFASNGLSLFGGASGRVQPLSVAVQEDNKIVVAGIHRQPSQNDGFVLRLNADGTPDLSFADQGLFIFDQGSNDQFNAVRLDDSSNILVAGDSYINGSGFNAIVIRLKPNGELDADFADNGIASINLSAAAHFYGLDVTETGIFAVGYSSNGLGLAVRLSPDGQPDGSFGTNGIAQLANSADAMTLRSAKWVSEDNKLLVAGTLGTDLNKAFLLRRLKANAVRDSTFNGNGEVVLSVDNMNVFYDIQTLPDGKILAAGTTGESYVVGRGIVFRFNPDGSPDPTFGDNGSTADLFPGRSSAFYHLQVLPDGSMFVSGYERDSIDNDALVIHLLADGTPDPAFGQTQPGSQVFNVGNGDDDPFGLVLDGNGKVWMGCSHAGPFASSAVRYAADGSRETIRWIEPATLPGSSLYNIAAQPDGKILLAGDAAPDKGMAFYRFLPDGTPDTGFGEQGALELQLQNLSNEIFYSLAVQGDGKIVAHAIGSDATVGSLRKIVFRLLSDGTPDPALGPEGLLYEYDNGFNINDMLPLPGHKVLIGGSIQVSNAFNIYLVQLQEDGWPDPDFGLDGIATFEFGASESAWEIATDPAGRVMILFGSSWNGVSELGVLCLLPDGQPDAGFGDNGIAWLPISYPVGVSQGFPAIAVQSDGRVLVGLSTNNPSNQDLALYCLLPDGSLDPDFGLNGQSTQDISGQRDVSRDLIVLPDGGILQCGETYNGSEWDAVLVRYLSSLTVGTADFSAEEAHVLVYPNPIGASTVLRYDNAGAGQVRIWLEDAVGRTIQTCFSGWQAAGEQTLPLRPDDTLQPGWYVCRIATAAGQAAVRVVKP